MTKSAPQSAAGDEMRRDRQEEPEQRLPAVLTLRRVDVDVHRVAAGRAGEAGERVGDQAQVREHVRLVAQVGGEEAVQGVAAGGP